MFKKMFFFYDLKCDNLVDRLRKIFLLRISVELRHSIRLPKAKMLQLNFTIRFYQLFRKYLGRRFDIIQNLLGLRVKTLILIAF